MRPLFFCLARPMNEEWKIRPYLGVLPLVFSALRAPPSLLARRRGGGPGWLCEHRGPGCSSARVLHAWPPARAPEGKCSGASPPRMQAESGDVARESRRPHARTLKAVQMTDSKVMKLRRADRNSAFSAPRIWTVLAGYLARLVSEPARRAAALSARERGAPHARERGRRRARAVRRLPAGRVLPPSPRRPVAGTTFEAFLARRGGRARVRDEPRAHDLADERGQVGRDRVHLVQQVCVQLQAVLGERDDAPRERLDVDHVDRADVLAHGRLGGLQDLARAVLVAGDLRQLCAPRARARAQAAPCAPGAPDMQRASTTTGQKACAVMPLTQF